MLNESGKTLKDGLFKKDKSVKLDKSRSKVSNIGKEKPNKEESDCKC